MSFDEDPADNRTEVDLCIEEIKQLKTENARLKAELETKELVEKRLRLSWKEEGETIARLKRNLLHIDNYCRVNDIDIEQALKEQA